MIKDDIDGIQHRIMMFLKLIDKNKKERFVNKFIYVALFVIKINR